MEAFRQFLKSWAGKALLAIFLLPFAFFGIEGYFAGSHQTDTVATVAKSDISKHEFQNLLTVQKAQLSEKLVDTSLIDQNVLKQQVLDGLIERRLIQNQAQALKLSLTDQQISGFLQTQTAFQDENGQFSNDKFALYLQSARKTKQQLFTEIRHDMAVTELTGSIIKTSVYPNTKIDKLIDLEKETRHIWLHRLDWQSFSAEVKVTDKQIADYFQAHQQDLNTPAMVDIDYVQITPEQFVVNQVPQAEVEQLYQQQLVQLKQQTQRHISHILLTGDDAATKLADIRQKIMAGANFADMAKQYSEDTGSKDSGGDIGILQPGSFGLAFENTAKGLKQGEVSEPIASEFGYHLVKVTKIDTPAVPSLASMQDELVATLKQQQQQTAYNDAIANINDMAVNGMSIADIAAQEKLTASTLKNYAKTGNTTPLNQPAVIAAAFDEFNIADQAVSVGVETNQATVWVQPSNYRDTQPQTLAQATPEINTLLTQQMATDLAVKKAQQIAQQIKQQTDIATVAQKAGFAFVDLGKVTRQNPILTTAEKAVAFSLPVAKEQNAITAVAETTDTGASILVASGTEMTNEVQLTDAEKQQTAQMIRDIAGQVELQDYLKYLRDTADVKINQEELDKL